MAVILTRSRFLHVPKTGGTWVTQAVARARMPHVIDERNSRHTDLSNSLGQGLFTFAFVRHPATWWQSYWVYRMMLGWAETLPLDVNCRDTDFNGFILRVLDWWPGYVSHAVYEPFVGRREAEIDFIGRYEHLAGDLVAALRAAGEEFDEAALLDAPPTNKGDYAQFDAAYRPAVYAALMKAEGAALHRFGYSP